MSLNELQLPLSEPDGGQSGDAVAWPAGPKVYGWYYHGMPPDGPNSCKPALKLTEPGTGWAVRKPLIDLSEHKAIVDALQAELVALRQQLAMSATDAFRHALEAFCRERHPAWDDARYFGEIAKDVRRKALAREMASMGPLPQALDACEVCKGKSGGLPGNENIVEGRVLCDYCHSKVFNNRGASV